MNTEIKVSLKEVIIRSVHIDIDSEEFNGKDMQISASGKSELKTPKDDEDLTFLLASKIEIEDKNNPDTFKASIIAEFIFESDIFISSYDDVVREQCLPTIQKELIDIVNKMLTQMGYTSFFSIDE